MSATLSRRWTEFAIATEAEAIDPETQMRARLALLDYLGVALAGSRTEVGRAGVAHVDASKGRGQSVLIGGRRRVPAQDAALANGISGHALELDDGHDLAAGHPGVAVIPGVLGLVDGQRVEYGDVLRAIVLGYEVFIVLGSAINPGHFDRGFHTTATVGPFAAALAAGAVAGLDPRRLADALGLAGLTGAGLMEAAHGAQGAKPFQVGRAGAAGVTAVQFALAGLAGPPAVLEGDAGFLRAMGGDSDPAAAEPPQSAGRWSIRDTYVKRHPSCRHTHPPIDLALALRDRINGHATAIEEVRVDTYGAAYRLCTVRDPADPGQAAFSIPFLVAAALERGGIGETRPDPEILADPQVRELAERVAVDVSDELEDEYPQRRVSRIAIGLRDGTRVEDRRVGAVGDPDLPLDPDFVEAKFLRLAATAITPRAAARLAATVLEGDPGMPAADLTGAVGRLSIKE